MNLEAYIKKVGRERWGKLEAYVKETNEIIGNDEVFLIVGKETIIAYFKTENTFYCYSSDVLRTIQKDVNAAFSDGRKKWQGEYTNAIRRCQTAMAWPRNWEYITRQDCIMIRYWECGYSKTARYAYTQAGWCAFMSHISKKSLSDQVYDT